MIATGVFTLLLAGSPFAYGSVPALSLSAGATSLVVTDGMVGDSYALSGTVLYTGPVGSGWNVVVTGITKTNVGSATAPVMDLSVSATSLGAGTLTILWSDNVFGPTAGAVTTMTGGNTPGSVSYSTFSDSANALFAQTTSLTSDGPLGPGPFNDTKFGALALGAPYSLTMKSVITHTGGGTSGFDASITIPEPSTWTLCAVGVVGLFLARRRGRTT